MDLGFFILLPLTVCIFWAFIILCCKRRNMLHFIQIAVFVASFFVLAGFSIFACEHYEMLNVALYFFIFSALLVYPLLATYVQMISNHGNWKKTILYSLIASGTCTLAAIILFALMGKEETQAYILKILYRKPIDYVFSLFGKMRIALYVVNLTFFFFGAVFYTIQIIRNLRFFEQKIRNYTPGKTKESVSSHFLSLTILIFTLAFTFAICGQIAHHSHLPMHAIVLTITIYSSLLFFTGIIFIYKPLRNKSYLLEVDFEKEHCTGAFEREKDEALYESSKLKQALWKLFSEQHIYTQPNLKVVDIATMLNTNRTYISTLINNEIGCNFSDLTNHFRIEHAKTLLTDPENKHLSIEEIAEQSGFANSNSFYRAFRKKEEMSPNQFRKEYLMYIYLADIKS